MQNELDSLLNSLLVQWHQWGMRCSMGRGYPTRDLTCRGAHASRQYDDENGALDAEIDNSVMEAFDHAAYRVPQPWLTALQFQAKNLSTGASVWRSPRLPIDALERAILTTEARNKLMRELMKDGVLS